MFENLILILIANLFLTLGSFFVFYVKIVERLVKLETELIAVLNSLSRLKAKVYHD